MQSYQHTMIDPRNHHSITSSPSEWNELQPTMTPCIPTIFIYTHGLVSTIPLANYSRETMIVIDQIYIGILPRSTYATINRFFSTFVTHQYRAHEEQFPRLQTTSHIMSIYWDYTMSQLDLLIVLNCLQPTKDLKLYKLISNTLEKVTIVFLQSLMPSCIAIHDHANCIPKRISHTMLSLNRMDPTLVQIILHTHLDHSPTGPPSADPKLNTTQQSLPYEHDRCALYAAKNMNWGNIIGRALFYLNCIIFNHAAKRILHIECTLRSRPRLRASMARWTYISDTQTTIITTLSILHTLRQHISPLLKNPRS